MTSDATPAQLEDARRDAWALIRAADTGDRDAIDLLLEHTVPLPLLIGTLAGIAVQTIRDCGRMLGVPEDQVPGMAASISADILNPPPVPPGGPAG